MGVKGLLAYLETVWRWHACRCVRVDNSGSSPEVQHWPVVVRVQLPASSDARWMSRSTGRSLWLRGLPHTGHQPTPGYVPTRLAYSGGWYGGKPHDL